MGKLFYKVITVCLMFGSSALIAEENLHQESEKESKETAVSEKEPSKSSLEVTKKQPVVKRRWIKKEKPAAPRARKALPPRKKV